MAEDLPVVNIWDYNGTTHQLVGRIAKYIDLECDSRYLTQGTWQMSVPPGAPHVEKLTPGRKITIDWAGKRWATGRLTAPTRSTGEDGQTMATFAGETGLTFFQGVMVYPVPTAGLGAQTANAYVQTGPAETVILNTIDAHYRVRYAKPITVPASLGRGAAVKARGRMDDLLSLVIALAQVGGVSVDVGLVNTSGSRANLEVLIRVPVDRSNVAILSSAIGSLRSWSWERTRPTMTRAIVGGSGAGAARVWRSVTTPYSEALATTWGGHVEGFVDASDTADTAELDQKGLEALEEALSGDTYNIEAASAPGMRIWDRAELGDKVRVSLPGETPTSEVLRGLRLTANLTDGVRVTPVLGDPDGSTPERKLARLLRQTRREARADRQRK